MALTPEQLQAARAKLGIEVPDPVLKQREMSFDERLAQRRAELKAAEPKLGQGAAGEFGAGVLGSLIKTGSTIEKGLDQTAGRLINAAQGRGFVPTTTGDEARNFAEKVTDQSAYSKAGEAVGTAAQYLAGPGSAARTAEAAGAKLLPKVGGFIARQAPEAVKDAAIGMANTGDPIEGAIQGATAFLPITAAKGATKAAGDFAEGAADRNIEKIADLVSPKILPVRGAKAIKSGKAEAQAPGLLTPGKISYANDPKTVKIVDAVKDVLGGGVKSASEAFNKVQGAITDTAENTVKPFLSQNRVPFDFRDLRGRLEQVTPSSGLKSDPGAFSTYSRVREEMLDDVANFLKREGSVDNMTDLNNLWDARKVMDSKIENELGQATFGSPQYTGVKAAARDMRSAFSKFITDSLENPGQGETLNKFYDFLQTARSKGVDIRNEGDAMEALRKQFGIQDFEEDVARAAFFKDNMEKLNLMYEAADNIAPKALAEAGKTQIQLWIKEHPIAAKALGLLGGGALAGLGFGGVQTALPN